MQSFKSFHKKHPSISTLILVVVVAGFGAGGYYGYTYWQYLQTPEAQFKRDSDEYKKDYEAMLETTKKQVVLPTDETPVIATVSDQNKLDDQAFFKQAQNGDKIIMYKENKKVFLYRPTEKQVIAQATLEFSEDIVPQSASEVAGTASAQIDVASDAASIFQSSQSAK